MAQLMPLPLTVSCFSKIQTGFTFLVPAHPGSPGKRAVKRVCVGEGVVAQERGHRTASPKTFYAEKTRSDYDCLLNESKVAYRNKVWLFLLLLFVYALA